MIRRVGHAPSADRSYRQRTGVYAILPLGREVLLTAQIGESVDIQLPGGGIDPGESPLRALHREVLEETGWIISNPRRLGAFRRFAYMPEYDLWAEKLCHVYVAHPVRQRFDPLEPDHRTVVLPPVEAAAEVDNDGDRHFLRRYYGV